VEPAAAFCAEEHCHARGEQGERAGLGHGDDSQQWAEAGRAETAGVEEVADGAVSGEEAEADEVAGRGVGVKAGCETEGVGGGATGPTGKAEGAEGFVASAGEGWKR